MRTTLTKADYEHAITGLREVQKSIADFLARGERAAHKDMKQVSPGIWIHKDFKDLGEATGFLRKLVTQ